MAEIPHYWLAYARLQRQAGQSWRVDAQSSAVEAGLKHLLGDLGGADSGDEDVARVIATARRREAHRCETLRWFAAEWTSSPDPEAALHARLRLKTIRSRLTGADWDVLCAVGAGWTYDEIAAARGCTPGGSRIRVFRLRRTLAVQDAA